MFGISFSEIILILVIALFIFGPKELPKIATSIGRFIYNIRTYFYNIKSDLYKNTGLDELRHTKQEIIDIYNNIRENINSSGDHSKIDSEAPFNDDNYIFFQPELDFDREPELFDELIDEPRTNK